MIRRNRVSHFVGQYRPVYFRAGGGEWRLIGHAQIDPRRRWRKRSTQAAPVLAPRIRRPIKRKPPRTCTMTMPAMDPRHLAAFLGVPYQEPAA